MADFYIKDMFCMHYARSFRFAVIKVVKFNSDYMFSFNWTYYYCSPLKTVQLMACLKFSQVSPSIFWSLKFSHQIWSHHPPIPPYQSNDNGGMSQKSMQIWNQKILLFKIRFSWIFSTFLKLKIIKFDLLAFLYFTGCLFWNISLG